MCGSLCVALCAGAVAACALGADDVAPAPTTRSRAAVAGESAHPESLRVACGNGKFEPPLEDCDEGASANASTACSSSCRSRDLLIAAPATVADGGLFQRTLGKGRHAVAASANGFAIVYVESNPGPRVVLRAFDVNGVAVGAPIALDPAGLFAANPSVAAVGSKYAVAWTAGARVDETDIALALVDPSTGAVAASTLANAVTDGAQLDADIAYVGGSQIVVAWTDQSDPTSNGDIRYRTFGASTLAATSIIDQTLAATPAVEGSVALTPFGSSWAAAWRDGQSDGERIRAVSGATSWTIGPFVAGAAEDRPALAVIDAGHLVAAYSTAIAPSGGGAAVPALRALVLNTADGSTTAVPTPASALAQDQQAAAVVGSTAFLSWHSSASTGDPLGEELYLLPLAWDGANLSASASAFPLPRWPVQQSGDQRLAAIAGSPIAGGALVMAWLDDGTTFGTQEGQGDIAFELAPVPITRNAGDPSEPPACGAGQAHCDATCINPANDANNCGACGTSCDGNACCGGACTNVSGSDVNNCGGCGRVCPNPANGQATCASGICGAVCNSPYVSCGGQCVSPNDPTHCGASCTVCAAPANGNATCNGTACGVSCNGGYHACGNACASNGDVATCGASCTPCQPPANATPTCDGTSCGFACVGGYHQCGGACSANNSINSCGSSCTPCTAPANATPTCDGTSCGFACNAGLLNCAGTCADVRSDLTNCGACGVMCPPVTNGSPVCSGGTCSAVCSAGFHACGSQCLDSNSINSCGSSCTPCAAPPGGYAACVGGACTPGCPPSATLCNGACVPIGDPTQNPCMVNESFGVFVSSSLGSPGGDGSRARPMFSIQAAISAAKAASKAVVACAESYTESLTLAEGVAMYGNYSCAGGAWAPSSGRALVTAANTLFGVRASAIHSTTRVDSFQFVTPDASTDASSIGMTVNDASGLWLTNCRVHAGNGQNGADGVPGASLTQTGAPNGTSGAAGVSVCKFPDGTVASPYYNGSAGGAGGYAGTRTKVCDGGGGTCGGKPCPMAVICHWEYSDPGNGSPGAGPGGGAGGVYGGAYAGDGAPGSSGDDGTSGGAIGTFSATAGYSPFNLGFNGTTGTGGSGGGGTAGGPATTSASGRPGTGGGAGGCPGTGATGGKAGGASVAIVAFNSAMRIERSQIESSNGGNGGRGAFGGTGTAGGTGGGQGGAGGRGGNGGNGGGGPSIGIASTGPGPVLVTTSTAIGAGGSGQPAMIGNGTTIAGSAGGIAQVQYAF